MCLVEQTLNARPLTSVSDDPDDLEALRQNHFLLGRANLATPFYKTLNVTPIKAEYFEYRKTSQI